MCRWYPTIIHYRYVFCVAVDDAVSAYANLQLKRPVITMTKKQIRTQAVKHGLAKKFAISLHSHEEEQNSVLGKTPTRTPVHYNAESNRRRSYRELCLKHRMMPINMASPFNYLHSCQIEVHNGEG